MVGMLLGSTLGVVGRSYTAERTGDSAEIS